MMMAARIKKILAKALEVLKLPVEKLALEHPDKSEHGDYSTSVALVLFAQKVGNAANPFTLAQQIVDTLRSLGLPDYLAKIEVEKPGFINIWLKNETLISEVPRVIKEKNKYGMLTGKGEPVMVEFAHPNTHKQFHIGHLRNLCLGEAVSRLLAANGQKLVRANYQGDVGLHVAKCLWALQRSRRQTPRSLDAKIAWLGQAYVKGNQAYEEDQAAKKQISLLNQKIYGENKEILSLWRQTRRWSLQYFDRIYQRLNTKFDRLYFESEVAEAGKQLVLKHPEIFVKSDGAVIFPGEKYGLHTRVFINQKGLPTYEAKDLGLAKLQFEEYRPRQVVHVVGPEQRAYFQVLFQALKQISPSTAGKEFHLAYGWVRLKEGKMASRTGQTVLGAWLLDEVKKRLQINFRMTAAVAEKVAVGAVKYSLLKFNTISEIVFDIDESINLAGNSGPYLQYTFARCQSVLRKAKIAFVGAHHDAPVAAPAPEVVRGISAEEIAVLRTLYKFPEVVAEAGEKYAPNLVCNFLFELASAYNLFYNKQSILKAAPEERKQFRLVLTAAVAQVVRNGLNLLGIEAVEKM
ncbi:arginine--tRNA ligase [Candidatus Shapirobacteria bacterium CG09_land_8_20_14_0_10_49_15]|uniref:Arginine--tRNA ligase n=1 Tax=Candidatus Shapirobacteria bacterium CG09_land_8_20_14_0_10_49_15 TaxID=1974482 RepID=A0A2M6XBH4_9BACT|nr:MAG: arginine--tRNA ligase [Candidatus Shapirobacteria bacterium CG09_land_8_20_14_0_10_49_15]